MRVIIVGSGGREHALAWAWQRDASADSVVVTPGNGGTPGDGGGPLDVTDATAVADRAVALGADAVVVGPDAALAAGVTDACRGRGLVCVGPSREAARLEASKLFAKQVMAAAGVPTAAHIAGTADSRQRLLDFAAERAGSCVVKADGLALGKGVTVCRRIDEVAAALSEAFDTRRFGVAGDTVLIEERLEGPEVSVFALCDGERVRMLGTACDYKRAYAGDLGPNTGGMGAYAPAEAGSELLEWTRSHVVAPVLAELRSRGTPFAGCLFVGLLLTDTGPRVLEFNVRFGDPEAQVLLPLTTENVPRLLLATATAQLEEGTVALARRSAVCVVATTSEYPLPGGTGVAVERLPETGADTLLFHAGTCRRDGRLVVTGGRVLNAVGLGDDLAAARARALGLAAGSRFDGMRYRQDIAAQVRPTEVMR